MKKSTKNIKKLDILDEVDKRLRTISEEVKFPLSEEDKNTINDIIDYLTNSQIEEIAEKYDLRPGMGLAAIQLGINKRYFVVVLEQEIKETFKNYVIINPKIVSNSEEMIYVEEGEGCLSVNREVDGIVPRHARITVGFYDINGNYKEERVREEISVAFQHEMDHLDGIMFTDRIDKDNPYKDMDKMRSI